MRRLPLLAVVVAPFALETLGIAGAIPEFRLLQMNRLGAGIKRALHADTEILAVILAGAHVIDVASVADLLAISLGLHFVLVVRAIETAIEVILILSPGYTRHHMDPVPV